MKNSVFYYFLLFALAIYNIIFSNLVGEIIIMSSLILKLIACVCMFCDHFSDAFWGGITFLNYIGRFSFTIFAFQIAQGYIHTHNIKKYIGRLFIFALISQIPYMLFYNVVFNKIFVANVIFTLLFGLLVILVYDKYNKFVGICSLLALGMFAEVCNFDYGFYGVFIVFMFYLLHSKKTYMAITFVLSVIAKYGISLIKYSIPLYDLFLGNTYSMCMYFTCFSIIPILFYNGKKGKDIKYLFYIFYPLHLFILALISYLTSVTI